jgi:hypothetical protein
MSLDHKRVSVLPKVSVTRSVTVTMCLIGLMVIGIVVYARITLLILFVIPLFCNVFG